jgi:sugar lactone lactonase YvrE
MAIAQDGEGNIFVADTLNHAIRKIDAAGNVTTLAGRPGVAGYRNGAGGVSLFREPAGIAVSEDGRFLYVADTGNHVIRRVAVDTGRTVTLAGVQEEFDECEEDGELFPLGGFRNGGVALFNAPRGLAVADNMLYIADSGNHRIRALCLTELHTATVAGNGEPGDAEGFALGAVLNNASGVFYYNGRLYIADTGNNKIKVLALM